MAIITEQIGDIFAAPPHSILIHACNAKGAWGSGVALAFKKKYPQAYTTYHTHCLHPPKTHPPTPLPTHQASLLGRTLLIPPSPTTRSQHWIACLFTSLSYGRNVSLPATILENTRSALEDLEAQMEVRKEGGEVWGVRINSGGFGVGWAETRGVLRRGGVDMVVVSRAGEKEEEEEEGREVGGKSVQGREAAPAGKGSGVSAAAGNKRKRGEKRGAGKKHEDPGVAKKRPKLGEGGRLDYNRVSGLE